MFQLENAIENWKSGLLCNQNITDGNADELENHLRDEVDSLMLSGLSDQEAFMVASHRIGDQQAIGQEFAKVNPSLAWRRRAFWMFFGILVSMLVSGIAGLCANGSAVFLTWMGISPFASGITSVILNVGIFLILLFAVIFGIGLLARSIKHKLTVSIALIACVISIFILRVFTAAFNIIVVRVWDVETMGKLSMAKAYGMGAWSLLWPLIVVVMLFVLWSSRPQRVR